MSDSPEKSTLIDEYSAPISVDSRQESFLVKVPEWLGKEIMSAAPGAIIGQSSILTQGLTNAELHLRPEIALSKPNSFNLRISQAVNPVNTFLVATKPEETSMTNIVQGMHALPTRDSKAYREIAHARAETAHSAALERKTILEDASVTRPAVQGNVHMFKLATPTPPETPSAKRSRGAGDVLPHSLRAKEATQNESNESPEEIVMRILVEEDVGWNLQNFMKKFKESRGHGLNLVQLKAKLIDICDYTRRGDDSFPKYYLKAEYKN
jgi:hypothetical protein